GSAMTVHLPAGSVVSTVPDTALVARQSIPTTLLAPYPSSGSRSPGPQLGYQRRFRELAERRVGGDGRAEHSATSPIEGGGPATAGARRGGRRRDPGLCAALGADLVPCGRPYLRHAVGDRLPCHCADGLLTGDAAAGTADVAGFGRGGGGATPLVRRWPGRRLG